MDIKYKEENGTLTIELPTVTCPGCDAKEYIELHTLQCDPHLAARWHATGYRTYPPTWVEATYYGRDGVRKSLTVCPKCKPILEKLVDGLMLDLRSAVARGDK